LMKNEKFQNYSRYIWTDSVSCADSEYDIIFDQIIIFLTEICEIRWPQLNPEGE